MLTSCGRRIGIMATAVQYWKDYTIAWKSRLSAIGEDSSMKTSVDFPKMFKPHPPGRVSTLRLASPTTSALRAQPHSSQP
ncbi:hypothetical protein PG985_013702 [Apiospora marii]|uniref:uncharacterized protein n=1 Tax=Apiospora marii TaxID=335849 RepID=UPI0031306DDD